MAQSMPSREECESWDPAQVASFLSQSGMWECASTVTKMKMDGVWFLNISESDLSRFSPIQRPQLQKMVQDIKKNDDSILNRLKRFQNEQTALIRQTGRSTLDRIKNKAPPQLPDRDYRDDNRVGNNCSGSDLDSDTYEDPQGENDDSYEPPPCERLFTPTSSMSMHREEYVDRCSRRPQPAPRIALQPPRPRAVIPPSRFQEEDEDYVKPEADTDDDYIEPSENADCPPVNRISKPSRPSLVVSESNKFTDVYEVPDTNDNLSSLRPSCELQPPPQRIPPRPSPRLHKRKPAPPPKPEPHDDDDDEEEDNEEYEICDGVENISVKSEEKHDPSPPMPLRRKNLLQRPKPSIAAREPEVAPHRPRPPEARSLSPRRGFHRARFSVCQGTAPAENGHRELEETALKKRWCDSTCKNLALAFQKAGVLKKPWYNSACDRKMAEKALLRSNKDGAYLVRKSSGHDAKQPFTLVVFYNGHVYNIPIRFLPTSQRYALGREKSGEEHFSSVTHIIENHQRNPLVLIDSQSNSKDSTKLLYPIQA